MTIETPSTATSEHSDSPPGRRARLLRRLPTVTAVVAVAVVAAIHLYAASGAVGPVWTDDEIGILANARVIAGVGEPLQLAHLSYYPGWSVVLAPLWWFTDDPGQVYRAAVVMSALCGIALLAPLAAIARRFGLGTPAAVVLASVIAVAPARAVMSTYVLTENALTLLTALTALAAVRYAERRGLSRAVALGALAGATFVTHGRMVAVLGMTFVWLGVEALRRRREALAGLAAAIAVGGGGFLLHLWVSEKLYGAAGSREASAVSSLDGIASVAGLRSLVGQLWYAGAAWLALPAVGVAVVIMICRAEARDRRPDLGWWTLGSVVGSVVISVPSVSGAIGRGSNRLDILAYGRYLEPLLVTLALVGLAWFVARARRRPLAVVLLVTATVVAVFQLWIVATAERGGWWAMINISGLLGRSWPGVGDTGPAPWWTFSAAAVLAAALYVVAARWRRARWFVVAVLGVYLLLNSVSALQRTVIPENAKLGAPPDLAAVVRALDVSEVSYDTDGADWVGQNLFQFWLTGVRVVPFDSSREEAPTDVVISRSDWPTGADQGALRVSGSRRDEALWVMPGATADAFERLGYLEPVDPADPLDDLGAEIELVDPTAVPVDTSGAETLQLNVTNEGDEVWPAFGTTDDPLGVVRVVLWWSTEQGPVAQFVELPNSVLPGASVEVDVTPTPPAGTSPGIDLGVTLVQEGVQEFTPPGEPLLLLPVTG